MGAVILFDDRGGRLAPLTDLRATFELRTGAHTTAERLARVVGEPVAYAVPNELAALVDARSGVAVNELPAGDALLLVNGRWTAIHTDLPTQVNSAIVAADGSVAAALLDRDGARRFIESGCELPGGVAATANENIDLITRPWHVIEHARANIVGDLEACESDALDAGAPGIDIVGDRPVRVGHNVQIGPRVVFDTTGGAVVIDTGARIEPFAVIQGPCYVGPDSVVLRQANVRANTVIGPVCKIGGEVSGSIFQGQTNKTHYGFVGDSFVGEWVNLGAGTTTSNLKNTYGEVSMKLRCDEPAEPTGMPFLGAVVGDHVKTGIGARLCTGTCIHTGAMVALSAIAPQCVGRFAFCTDAGTGAYRMDKFVEVARRVMARRGQEVSEALAQRLAELAEAKA